MQHKTVTEKNYSWSRILGVYQPLSLSLLVLSLCSWPLSFKFLMNFPSWQNTFQSSNPETLCLFLTSTYVHTALSMYYCIQPKVKFGNANAQRKNNAPETKFQESGWSLYSAEIRPHQRTGLASRPLPLLTGMKNKSQALACSKFAVEQD